MAATEVTRGTLQVNPLYRLSHDAALLLIALVREKAKVIAATLAEHSMALEVRTDR